MSTDKQILSAFAQGDPVAFDRIYKRFHTRIFVVAKRYVRCEEDAKDIRAKGFIKLWELRESLRFDNMGALFSWLRSTIANSCIDHLRSVNIRKSKQPAVIAYWTPEDDPVIFEASDKEAIILERLRKEIDLLPPKCKEVFKMRWLDDLKFREIAAAVNTDVSTIKKRYARAAFLLRSKMPNGYIILLLTLMYFEE